MKPTANTSEAPSRPGDPRRQGSDGRASEERSATVDSPRLTSVNPTEASPAEAISASTDPGASAREPSVEASPRAQQEQEPLAQSPARSIVSSEPEKIDAESGLDPETQSASDNKDRAEPADDAETGSGSDTRPSAPLPTPCPDETAAEGQASEASDRVQAQADPNRIVINWVAGSDVGLVREHNEDNFVVSNLAEGRPPAADVGAGSATSGAIELAPQGAIFLVCDGMGGAAAGEVAAQLAVDTVCEQMELASAPKHRDEFAWRLVRALEAAGEAIFALAASDRRRRGMGTTATLAGLVDKVLFVGQVGDSRAYVLRNQWLGLISKDQSLVNQLLEAGQLTESEAQAFEHSNIILQALGTAEELTVDLTFLELRRGDLLLLCSDGLSGMVPLHLMQEVLNESTTLDEKLAKLIAHANRAGGHDNSTVVLAVFDGEGLQVADDGVKVAYQQYPLVPADEASQGEPDTRAGRRLRTRSLPTVSELEAEPTRPGHGRNGSSPGLTSGLSARTRRWHLPLAVMAALFAVVAGAWFFGAGKSTPGHRVEPQAEREATRPDIAHPVRVEVSLPVAADALFVDGVLEGQVSATGTVETELWPGLYRFEARSEEDVLVGEVVEVPAVGVLRVELLLNDPFVGGSTDKVNAETEGPRKADAAAAELEKPKARNAGAEKPNERSAAGARSAGQAKAVPAVTEARTREAQAGNEGDTSLAEQKRPAKRADPKQSPSDVRENAPASARAPADKALPEASATPAPPGDS